MSTKEEKLSPSMHDYMLVKQKYNDCIVLNRMGDFYEFGLIFLSFEIYTPA